MIKVAIRTLGMVAVGAIAIGSIVTASAQEQPKAEASVASTQAAAEVGVKKFTLVSEQIGDTKFWLPSTIVVEPGDKVTLTLKNEVPGTAVTHGFELPQYKISEVVTRGKPDVVHFTADKPGIYPYYCQLHPAHIGGQLIVEPAAK